MKKIILKLLPKPIKNKIIYYRSKDRLKKNMIKDMERFKKHSYVFGKTKDKRHYEADLIFYYHKIEKGLALPEPKVGFGKRNIQYILKALNSYVKKYGWDEISSITLDTLEAYYQFNLENNLEMPKLNKQIQIFRKTLPPKFNSGIGGVTKVYKHDIDKSNIDFKNFAFSRYSIRNFTDEEVEDSLIEKAVMISQKTPSVCNRQSAKVYSYKNTEDKKNILQYQNGNAGFGHTASHVLIVTMELKDFRGIIERNQSYIDGGMYAMSLIYALHSLGLGTCPLNLSITNNIEDKIKKTTGISDSEVLIMMIAVGHIPKELYVASSPRRTIDKVLTLN